MLWAADNKTQGGAKEDQCARIEQEGISSGEFIVKNKIYFPYASKTLRSLRALRCMIFFTAKSAKYAKIVELFSFLL